MDPQDGIAPMPVVAGRLAHVAERFSTFYSDLEATKQHRRDVESNRWGVLSETVAKVERSLEAEIVRRAEADKALVSRFDAEVKAMEDRMALHLREVQTGIKASIDALARTFSELHTSLREERELRRSDMQRLADDVQLKLEETQAALDDERVARLERECSTLKKIGEDVFRMQESIETERATREAFTSRITSEVSHMTGGRSVADERFQAALLQELSLLKNAIQTERAERISEDETIVAAVSDYTRAMQDGLRIVSST